MISIIIVTYNSGRCIGACLESLQSSGAEIIVVDNGSTDDTAERVRRFPRAKLLEATRNLGFAAACNLGARQSTGETLLFLNPDTVCRARLDSLEEVLRNRPEVVAVAPRLINAEGENQIGFNVRRLPTRAALLFEILLLNRAFPRNPVNRRYRCLDFHPDRASEVEQPAGACLGVRREGFERCGGFDEGFFPLWFEDVDLCRRLRQDGGKILYCPDVRFEHVGGHSLEAMSFSDRQVYWYRNLLYYVRKHFGWGTGVMIRCALLVGIALRIAAELAEAVLDRKTPARVRGAHVRAYCRAAMVSFSAAESGSRISA
jgi:GT2 family glycosyltransferase